MEINSSITPHFLNGHREGTTSSGILLICHQIVGNTPVESIKPGVCLLRTMSKSIQVGIVWIYFIPHISCWLYFIKHLKVIAITGNYIIELSYMFQGCLLCFFLRQRTEQDKRPTVNLLTIFVNLNRDGNGCSPNSSHGRSHRWADKELPMWASWQCSAF